MNETNKFNNWHAFEYFAGEDLNVWRQIEGRRIQHRKMGNGIVIRVEIQPSDKDITLWVDFLSQAPNFAVNNSAVKMFRLSDRKVTDDFVDIDVPPEVVTQVSEVRQRLQQMLESEAERNRIGQLLKDTVAQLMDASIEAKIPVPSLGYEDGVLVTKWLRGMVANSRATSDKLQEIAEHGSSVERYQLGRLLSARAAEIAAADFYRCNGMDVVDVSITQICEPEGNEWRTFDLLVDGVPVDVKNARNSRPHTKTYVEHCVPQFKLDRDNNEVEIVGVLSTYLKPSQLLAGSFAPSDAIITILGSTSLDRIRLLKQEFDSDFLQIEFSRSAELPSKFLPPWLFDYPSRLYSQRDEKLRVISSLEASRSGIFRSAELAAIPLHLALGITPPNRFQSFEPSSWQLDLWNRWLQLRSQYGLSLPFLYLSILSQFLFMVRQSSDSYGSYDPIQYQRMVFPEQSERGYRLPLFISDPLSTIYSLIQSLNTLWNANRWSVKSFQKFRLAGLNILSGYHQAANQWITLLAYCRCGVSPLILGSNETCAYCGRLICRKCDSCSSQCQRDQHRIHNSQLLLSEG